MRRVSNHVFGTDFLALFLLALVSLGGGLLINEFRAHPLPLIYQSKAERLKVGVQRIQGIKEVNSPVTALQKLPEKMSLEEFSVFVTQKRGLILDARPSLFYRIGHVLGAVSLPREEFEQGYARLKSRLEANRAQTHRDLLLGCHLRRFEAREKFPAKSRLCKPVTL